MGLLEMVYELMMSIEIGQHDNANVSGRSARF